MVDKISDNEIVKALECCYNSTCGICPYNYWDCYGKLDKDALDLINRQKAEIEKGENVIRLADKTIETANAEIERLKKSNRNWRRKVQRLRAENKLLIDNDVSNKYPNCVLVEKGRIYAKTLEDYENLIGGISAEAYKEFAERLKERFAKEKINECYIVIDNDVDNLLKELVGDENDR